MKLKTSSSDATLFRKNLTRFAPVWTLYSIFLLLSFLLMHNGESYRDFARNVTGSMSFMPSISLVYALICGQLLFGDLFNTRLCNGIHSLPVSRPQLFRVNFLSGLAFAWVPNLIIALFALPFLNECWIWALLWLCFACGSYLIFFILAIFCAVSTGSRFGMALLFALINSAAPIAWWLMDTIYMPYLPGLVLDWESFGWFCPVYALTADAANLIKGTVYIDYLRDVTIDPSRLVYLLGLSAVSLALAWGTLKLYARRHLESAGDLLAFPFLKPIFLTVYTLVVGACVHFFFELFFYNGSNQLYLYVGIVIGFFTGCMLLARSPRVFTGKNWMLCGGFAALVLCSMLITIWDPLGLVSWVPEEKEVEQATVTIFGHQCYGDDAESLNAILDSHSKLLTQQEDPEDGTHKRWYNIDYVYKLNSGQYAHRRYAMAYGGEAMEALRPVLSKPEFVLGELYTNWDNIDIISIRDYYNGDYATIPLGFTQEELEEFYDALMADCEAGNMISTGLSLHDSDMTYFITILYQNIDDQGTTLAPTYVVELQIYPESENTIAWLEDHGFQPIEYDKDK